MKKYLVAVAMLFIMIAVTGCGSGGAEIQGVQPPRPRHRPGARLYRYCRLHMISAR